jgi:hypothetical protein
VRHSSFSPLAATALSRIGATSTLCAGAAVAGPHDFSDDAHRIAPCELEGCVKVLRGTSFNPDSTGSDRQDFSFARKPCQCARGTCPVRLSIESFVTTA